MNIRFRSVPFVGVRRFQQGGPMEAPEEAGAPAEGGAEAPEEGAAPEQGGAPEQGQQSGDPMEMLMQIGEMAAQALQGQNCEQAMQACDGIVQFIQMMQQGGGGQGAPQGEPVYRRGGKIVGYIRK